jgi:hypothetical protein
LYLSICSFLLPAIGSILKIRKRKLAQVSASSDNSITVSFLKSLQANIIAFNTILESSNSSTFSETLEISKSIDSVSIKFGSLREFSSNIFAKAQQTSILY